MVKGNKNAKHRKAYQDLTGVLIKIVKQELKGLTQNSDVKLACPIRSLQSFNGALLE